LTQKVLITGGAGYLGSELTKLLLKKKIQVIVVDTFYFGFDKLTKHPNLKIFHSNINNFNFKKKVDCVIDLAAVSNDPSGKLFKKSTKETNYLGRFELAKKAKKFGIKKYILISSCSVYGKNNTMCYEDTKTNPLTEYSKNNLKAEKDILKLSSKHFSVTVLRLATLFGFSNRMRLDLAINNMLYEGYFKGTIPLLRDGSQQRPFININFVNKVIAKIINEKKIVKIQGQIFNVGHEEYNLKLKDLASLVKKIILKRYKKKSKIVLYGSKDNRDYFVNFDKLKKLSSFKVNKLENEIEKLLNNFISKKISVEQSKTLDWYNKLYEWNNYLDLINYNDHKLKK